MTLHDPDRLAALRALHLLDTTPEREYDDLARLAAAVTGAAVGAVNLVDDERHFTKAAFGAPGAAGTSLTNELSFCAATVAGDSGELVVADTHADPRFAGHPLVVGGPQVRGYAGVAVHARGERVGVLCGFGPQPLREDDGGLASLRAVARQLEAQLALRLDNLELRHAAETDPLTGLANRLRLCRRLDRALATPGASIGLVFCDLDGLKRVNDTLGHTAGDGVLCDVADHLRRVARPGDLVARLHGDEFILAGPVADEEELHGLATAAGRPGLSVGAVMSAPGEDAAGLLHRADAAMYAVKPRRRSLAA